MSNCQPIVPWKTFNGTSDFVSIPSSSRLQLKLFTVAVWFKTSKDYSKDVIDGMIINKGGTGGETAGKNQNYGIRVFKETNKIRAGFETKGGTDHEPASPNKVNDGLWHFCVCTNDGNIVRLYLEGLQVQQHTHNGATPDYTNTQPLVLGRNSHDSTRFFQGDIYGAKIWNRAISNTEVSNIFVQNQINRTGLVFETLENGAYSVL